MTPALETKGPLASTSSKPPPEVSKHKPKGPHKKQKGPKNHQGKGKVKVNWHRPYPTGTGSQNWSLQPWTVSSIWPGLLWNSKSNSRKG
ncbi:hypothetical protein O181_054576 [Austropuccinia psidii MF-1]|uniref:Uncharacterized protein n=1 Tax=Austropuccinia psidii MF-1 TaxID=1389203 RepID=A0A9Q3E2T2_9BASI|nr:hypothetical protein [Austropuccinia psidii MF-1]